VVFVFTWLAFILYDGVFFGGVLAPGICLAILFPMIGIAIFSARYAVLFLFLSITSIMVVATLDLLNILPILGVTHKQYIVLVMLSYSLQSFLSFCIGNAYETARREFEIRLVEISRLGDLSILAAGVSHEINNPMTVIKSTAELCEKQLNQDKFDPTIARQGLHRIQKAVDTVSKIVNLLSEYTQSQQFEPTEFYLEEVISDTLSLCRQRIEQAKIRVELPSSTNQILIKAIRSDISRALMTLINNSYDAVTKTEDRWILISIHKSFEFVDLSVTDSGHGIPQELRKYLFTPFFTTKPPAKGLGLALYYTASIINLNKGRIYFDENAQHTKFTIRLPATD
jgi:C4-dicarboxylate-specific signal transduction histidine kinase